MGFLSFYELLVLKVDKFSFVRVALFWSFFFSSNCELRKNCSLVHFVFSFRFLFLFDFFLQKLFWVPAFFFMWLFIFCLSQSCKGKFEDFVFLIFVHLWLSFIWCVSRFSNRFLIVVSWNYMIRYFCISNFLFLTKLVTTNFFLSVWDQPYKAAFCGCRFGLGIQAIRGSCLCSTSNLEWNVGGL